MGQTCSALSVYSCIQNAHQGCGVWAGFFPPSFPLKKLRHKGVQSSLGLRGGGAELLPQAACPQSISLPPLRRDTSRELRQDRTKWNDLSIVQETPFLSSLCVPSWLGTLALRAGNHCDSGCLEAPPALTSCQYPRGQTQVSCLQQLS